jgi:hypothetical protein
LLHALAMNVNYRQLSLVFIGIYGFIISEKKCR